MEIIKEIKKLFKTNLNTILKFEFVFKLLTIFIVSPIFLGLYKLLLKILGYRYLTIENLFTFLLNPISIVLIFILLLLICFYSLFDIGVIICMLDISKQGKKANLKEIIRFSLKKSLETFKYKNFGFIILLLFLIPFLNIGITSGVISTIKIPEFILDFIFSNRILLFLYIFIILILFLLLIKWIYSIHYYFIENLTYKQSRKLSSNLVKKNYFKTILGLIIPQIILFLLFFIIVIIGIIIISLISTILKKFVLIETFFISIIAIFIIISLVIYWILNVPIGYMCISYLFYKNKEINNEKINHLKLKPFNKKDNRSKNYTTSIILLLVGFIGVYITTYNIIKGNYNLTIEGIKSMEVTAHRGASVQYPENTMSAFKGAKKLGADWVELDVQQTKDGYIIVSHDTNFARVSGKDLNCWETNLSTIKTLDVGSFKSSKFKDERIPLLEDVIKWAKKNNIKLNIELKPTGYEKDFEKRVLEIIEKYNFENECVITSQVYNVIKTVKKLNKKINTVYVMSIAFGEITELKYADNFSIEASNITYEMVSDIHKKGKQIYAWTINTEESIEEMIDMGVDNIITDDIVLGKQMVLKEKNSTLINRIINVINKILFK